jgi:hypothetical protein
MERVKMIAPTTQQYSANRNKRLRRIIAIKKWIENKPTSSAQIEPAA